MYKPTLVLDFDGVIHNYQGDWTSPRIIKNSAVPGALEFIVAAQQHFQVAVFSARSRHFRGRAAMKQWLFFEFIAISGLDWNTTPDWWRNKIAETAFADPWMEEVSWAARKVIKEIKWPLFKPPCRVGLDDRLMLFEGTWPDMQTLLNFKPWNRKE